MKTIKFLILSIIICIIFSACKKNEKVEDIFLLQTESVPDEKVLLSSLIEEYKIIPLQSSEKALLGDIIRIAKYDHKFYISYDRKALAIFNDKGEFANKIDDLGRGGKQEYLIFGDFDFYQDTLITVGYNKLFFYNLNGEYIKNQQLAYIGKRMKITPDRKIILQTPESYYIHIVDFNGNIIEKLLPANEALALVRPEGFQVLDDNILYQKGYSGDFLIYNLTTGKISEESLVKNENQLTVEIAEGLIKQHGYLEHFTFLENYILLTALQVTKHQIFAAYKYHEKSYMYALNKENNHMTKFRFPNLIDDVLFSNARFIDFAYSGEDYFISYVWPADIAKGLKAFAEQYPDKVQQKSYVQIKTMIDSIPDLEYANPFIIEYKFK